MREAEEDSSSSEGENEENVKQQPDRPPYYLKLKPFLDQAKALNPHLTSSNFEHFAELNRIAEDLQEEAEEEESKRAAQAEADQTEKEYRQEMRSRQETKEKEESESFPSYWKEE